MSDNNAKTKREFFGRLLLLTVTALVLALSVALYAVSTFGWFAKTFSVEGSDMNVKAKDDFFDLAVTGDQVSPYASDAAIVRYLALSENGGFLKLPSTDNSHQAIICHMTNENPHVPDSDEMAPGAYGKISFDIVPKGSGRTSFNISIDMLPLASVGGTPAPLDAAIADELTDLLSGHILLYLDRSAASNGGYYYSERITDGTFVFDTTEHTAVTMPDGDHYTVDVYWIWPATFGQVALDGSNPKLHNHAVYGDYTNAGGDPVDGDAERAEILESMANEHGKFFKSLNPGVNFSRTAYEDYFFVELTDSYNLADQFIGERVQFLVAAVNVD